MEGDGEEIKAWLAGFNISIHALQVEGDTIPTEAEVKALLISIHALRVEGDEYGLEALARYVTFLSTPSGWRATA